MMDQLVHELMMDQFLQELLMNQHLHDEPYLFCEQMS